MVKIYFIMWVSWAWKWTLIKNLQKINTNQKMFFPLSYKTRPKRESELDWIDAKFISNSKFEKMIDENEFLEYAKVHNMYYYWSSIEDIKEWIKKDKVVIKELDMNWLEKLKKNLYNWIEYKTIFLSIDDNKLKERIEKRWDFMSEDELQNRLNSLKIELEKAHKICDYIIDASQKEEEILKQVVNILVKNYRQKKEEEIVNNKTEYIDDGDDILDFLWDSADFFFNIFK